LAERMVWSDDIAHSNQRERTKLLAGLSATLDFECEFQIKIEMQKLAQRGFLVQERLSCWRTDIDAMSTYDGTTAALSRIPGCCLLNMYARPRVIVDDAVSSSRMCLLLRRARFRK